MKCCYPPFVILYSYYKNKGYVQGHQSISQTQRIQPRPKIRKFLDQPLIILFGTSIDPGFFVRLSHCHCAIGCLIFSGKNFYAGFTVFLTASSFIVIHAVFCGLLHGLFTGKSYNLTKFDVIIT